MGAILIDENGIHFCREWTKLKEEGVPFEKT